MSTHASVTFFDNNDAPLVSFYKHGDGNLADFGNEISEFLYDMVVVNGISRENTKKIANGMGCLAAQFSSHFKRGVGDFYIRSITSEPEEFDYSIHRNSIAVALNGHEIFNDSWEEFYNFFHR